MQKNLIIFDFDGVLVETLLFCFNLNKETNPNMSYEEYQKMSHGIFFTSFESEVPTVAFTPSPTYHDDYKNGIRNFCVPSELKEGIINLSKENVLVVVSSGSETVIRHFLEKENIADSFSDILGFETHKRKVVKFKLLLEKYSLDSSHAIFVTDTLGDILEANEVGIKSIGVTWGLHDKETLKDGNPKSIVDSPADLLKDVKDFLNK